jgi:hypothetical protein
MQLVRMNICRVGGPLFRRLPMYSGRVALRLGNLAILNGSMTVWAAGVTTSADAAGALPVDSDGA